MVKHVYYQWQNYGRLIKGALLLLLLWALGAALSWGLAFRVGNFGLASVGVFGVLNLLISAAFLGLLAKYLHFRHVQLQAQTVLDSITDAVLSFDVTGTIVLASGACRDVTGYNAAEVMGRPFTELLSERDSIYFRRHILPALIRGGEGYLPPYRELRGLTKSGHSYALELTLSTHINTPNMFTAVLRDNSEQNAMVQALMASDRKFSCVMDNLIDGAVLVDAQREVTFMNQAASELFGRTEEEVLGRHLSVLFARTSSGDMAKVLKPDGKLADMGLEQGGVIITQGRHVDGHTFPAELTVSDVVLPDGEVMRAIVVRDMSLAKQMHDQLEDARDAAVRASQAKTDFLANMSHEIRTPMNAILGMNTLLSETRLDEKQRQYVDIVTKAGEALVELISDILDVSKIEAGQMQLEHTPFDMTALAKEVVDILQNRAVDKGIKLTLTGPTAPMPPLMGDAVRIRQVFYNLVGNAIKFTNAGSVTVSLAFTALEAHRGQVVFTVADTGIGIPQSIQKAIFDGFTQADMSTTRQYGGTGLGLTICQHLCTHMGGGIRVASTPGEGSTFTVTLPFEVASKQAAIPKAKKATTQQVAAPRQPKVLLAEDNPDNRLVVKLFLQGTQAHITEVHNGREAVLEAQRTAFDVILMDMQMPIMDGLSATQAIREDEAKHNKTPVPIIALTAHAMKEDKDKAHAAGCTTYLTKPLTKDKLLHTISEYGLFVKTL